MSNRLVDQGRGLEVEAVTAADRRVINQAFKNPLEIPPIFKGWLEAFLEPIFDRRGAASGITIPTTDVGTSLPASPSDKQEFVLVDSLTAPTYAWMFKYFAGISDANKWVFIGGSPAHVAVDTSEATASTTYAALTTAGPSLALSRGGVYLVEVGFAHSAPTNSGNALLMSYDNGGTGAVDADAAVTSDQTSAAFSPTPMKARQKTVTAGTSLVCKYRISTAVSLAFRERWMRVVPVRVS